ncbi:hypothetical protein FKP32DRAFT_1544188, partial [Trametes sanguinea]
QRAILVALRDPVGVPDFALHANGGRVLDTLTSTRSGERTVIATPLHPPEIALNEDMRIGSCWLIPDAQGQLAIVIPNLVYPTNVTIDHVPREISLDIGQAPRRMRLWGLLEDPTNLSLYQSIIETVPTPTSVTRPPSSPPLSLGYKYALLGDFSYDIHAPPVQTFEVDPKIVAARIYFGLVVLEVVDNWGGSSTCLYRVRIHGD